MSTINWGLVGYGEQAKRMMAALKSLKDCQVTGVCCSSEESGQNAEKELGIKGYGKFADFLADPEIQIVYIASPHHLHTPQAFKAAEAGKNVLVEKPMALSVDGAHKLIDVARKTGVVLGVNFPLRQHPCLQELKEEIKAKGLGDIVHAYIHLSRKQSSEKEWWRDQFHSGPMCLMDLGVQGIDLLMWLVGEPTSEISTLGRGGKDDGNLNLSALVSINFAGGTQAVSSSNNLSAGERNFILLQGSAQEVMVEMNWPEGDGAFTVRKLAGGRDEEKRHGPLDLLKVSAQNFSAAVAGGPKYSPCCEETYAVVEATCAAIESLKRGQSIKAGQISRVSGVRFKE